MKIEIKNNQWLNEITEKCFYQFFRSVNRFYHEDSQRYCNYEQFSHITWTDLDKNVLNIDSLTECRYFSTKKECLDYIKQIIEEDINYFIFEERE